MVEGRIGVAHLGEWRDLDSGAFSEGQRWELVLGWLIKGAELTKEPRVVVVDQGECPIDDNGLRRLSPLAAAKGLAIYVEKEEADSDLHLEHMGGA